MASALQCPACGHKHRLSELTGDPIFSCEQCGRLLKTPMEYRRPDASGPVDPVRSNGTSTAPRGRAAKRDRTSVTRKTPAPTAAASAPAATAAAAAPAAPRRRVDRTPATLTIPLQIIGWVLALLLGGIIVRYIAKFTGVLTGDSIIDLITGSGFGRYLRLFAVVPFWALASAGLMTLFIEGARRWQARQDAPSARPVKQQRLTVPPAKPRPAGETTGPKPVTRDPAPVRTSTSSSSSGSTENRVPADAATAPRTRRIPKRDIS
jgi:hypothetical protein